MDVERPTGRRLTVQIFGPLVMYRHGVAVPARALGGCKPRHLLEILLLNLGTPVSKDCLIDMLWSSRPGDGVVATLESYVSVIRRAIQPGMSKDGPLRTTNRAYVIDHDHVELDFARFGSLLEDAKSAGPEYAYPLLVEALRLSSQPLLALELTTDWAEDARNRHDAQRVAAMIDAAEAAAELKKYGEAAQWAREAARIEPLNERAWIALIRANEAAGLPAEGLAAYEQCRRTFDGELACLPGPALQSAHLRLLRQQADTDPELSEVMAAILYLGHRLQQGEHDRRHVEPFGERQRQQAASRVLSSFLERVRASA